MQHYSVSVSDNDSHMCSSVDSVLDGVVGLEVCPECRYRTNFEFVNPDFELRRRTHDLSRTYDGYCIASLKFMEAITREGLIGIDVGADSNLTTCAD